MNKWMSIGIALVLFAGLFAIRLFEDALFYDPLLAFFKTDHATEALPELNKGKLILHVVFRFVLNTALSLLIIWVLFKEKGFVRLSLVLYGILFAVLLSLFTVLLFTSEGSGHMTLFYVRRFLIQPLFLLVLLPAFYFYRRRGQ